MTAEIICIGTEILLGNIVNSNAAYLSQKCADLGISVFYHDVVGDNFDRAKAVFMMALNRSDIIITTGGLGPTDDDISKDVAASALGLDYYFDRKSFDDLSFYFKKKGMECFPLSNNKQAYIPEGGIPIENKNGTAPGIIIETDKTKAAEKFPHKTIIQLPGPPREMKPMMEEKVIPFLSESSCEVIKSVMVKMTGIGEGKAAEILGDLIASGKNPTVAPYAKPYEVHFRLTAKAASEAEACNLIVPVYKTIEERLGKYIYSTKTEETLEDVVVKKAIKQGVKLACAESCTGGLLCGRIINVSGASNCFTEGFITYSNEAKTHTLNVPENILDEYGAVSAQCAEAMAEGAALVSGADVAISTTGIAGPSGGSKEKPVGLVYFGICDRGNISSFKYVFNGNRAMVRENAVSQALDLLWRII